MGEFARRIFVKALRELSILFFQYPRVWKYRFISPNRRVEGRPILYQPLLTEGMGRIVFGENVKIGVKNSPHFYSGYTYIDARTRDSVVQFGDDVWINNNCAFISEGPGIYIGNQVLIGANCEFMDSDFHDLHPSRRMGGNPSKAKIIVKDNVFFGLNVRVLKGVTIGENAVIANGAIVTKDVSDNTVVAGVPARVVGRLDIS